MGFSKYSIVFLFLAGLFQFQAGAQIVDESETGYNDMDFPLELPAKVTYITDFENILTFEELDKLERLVFDYQMQTNREIAVFTVKSLKYYDNLSAYAAKISEGFKSERQEKSNGLTILVCTTSGNIRITTGSETKKVLNKKVCQQIIDEIMLPEFQNGNYYVGMEKGITEIIKKWN